MKVLRFSIVICALLALAIKFAASADEFDALG